MSNRARIAFKTRILINAMQQRGDMNGEMEVLHVGTSDVDRKSTEYEYILFIEKHVLIDPMGLPWTKNHN